MKRVLLVWSMALVVMVSIGTEAWAGRKLVKVDGSSTVFPITEAVAEEFQIEKRGKVMVTVGVSGTGGGFKKFCRGEIDICNASRPIKAKEVELCKKNGIGFLEFPVAYDGIAVMVHPKNTWVDYLTVEELKRIWEPSAHGKIVRWNQVRKNWPPTTIELFGPGVDSGTFDYFTKVIVGKEGASRGDFTASEDDNVLVQGISTHTGALGYFGLAYYENNMDRLKLVPIDDGDDTNGRGPILPTRKTITDGTYQPLSRPIFIYVSTRSAEKKEINEFVRFYLKNAGTLSEEVGYVPLPDEMYRKALERLDRSGS